MKSRCGLILAYSHDTVSIDPTNHTIQHDIPPSNTLLLPDEILAERLVLKSDDEPPFRVCKGRMVRKGESRADIVLLVFIIGDPSGVVTIFTYGLAALCRCNPVFVLDRLMGKYDSTFIVVRE